MTKPKPKKPAPPGLTPLTESISVTDLLAEERAKADAERDEALRAAEAQVEKARALREAETAKAMREPDGAKTRAAPAEEPKERAPRRRPAARAPRPDPDWEGRRIDAGDESFEVMHGALDDTLPEEEQVRRRTARAPAPEEGRRRVPGKPIRPGQPTDEIAVDPFKKRRRAKQPFWWKVVQYGLCLLLSSGVTLYFMQTGDYTYLAPALVVLAVLFYFALRGD